MKMYTAQDMRDAAKCLFACEVDLKHDPCKEGGKK